MCVVLIASRIDINAELCHQHLRRMGYGKKPTCEDGPMDVWERLSRDTELSLTNVGIVTRQWNPLCVEIKVTPRRMLHL